MALADVLADHPDKSTFDLAELHRAIQAASDCASICMACADSDLSRDPAGMTGCIRSSLDCAEICRTTASVLSRPAPTGKAWAALVEACIKACAECAAECEQHDHVCCQECAKACRETQKACQQLLAAAAES